MSLQRFFNNFFFFLLSCLTLARDSLRRVYPNLAPPPSSSLSPFPHNPNETQKIFLLRQHVVFDKNVARSVDETNAGSLSTKRTVDETSHVDETSFDELIVTGSNRVWRTYVAGTPRHPETAAPDPKSRGTILAPVWLGGFAVSAARASLGGAWA